MYDIYSNILYSGNRHVQRIYATQKILSLFLLLPTYIIYIYISYSTFCFYIIDVS